MTGMWLEFKVSVSITLIGAFYMLHTLIGAFYKVTHKWESQKAFRVNFKFKDSHPQVNFIVATPLGVLSLVSSVTRQLSPSCWFAHLPCTTVDVVHLVPLVSWLSRSDWPRHHFLSQISVSIGDGRVVCGSLLHASFLAALSSARAHVTAMVTDVVWCV